MRIPGSKFTLDKCLNAMALSRGYYEDCKKVIEDPDKKNRLEKSECVLCYYYYGKIGGSVMTSTECGSCNKELSFGNTCVDVLCPECAKKYRVCRHCGADLELKSRRKLS